MSRHGFHTFTSSAPVFGFDEDFIDPFYDQGDRAASPHGGAPACAAEARPSPALEGWAPVETMNG